MKSFTYKLLYRTALYLKKILIPFIPQAARKTLKRRVMVNAYGKAIHNFNNEKLETMSITGINLIGYSRAEMGIGESCRIAAKSIATTDIPFGILNYKGTNSARMSDLTWSHKEVESPNYNLNIFHLNAEQMTEAFIYYGEELFRNRYNIGYWHWELPDFPETWLDGFKFVDEVWVPSTYVATSVSFKSTVPVITIPHSIEVKIELSRDRTYYGLPENTFLFLTMYDMNSFQQRKNPEASIEAFKKAFEPDDMTVGLVVKVNNSHSNRTDMRTISQITSGYKNIHVINETLSRNDTNALIQCTDSYISLHRSEGFGLGLAEAMYLGKPAIGTNWSANTDFMNQQNSCLVNYEMIHVGMDYGPYEAYQTWANPDVEHASYYMRRLVTDNTYRDEISLSGQQTIKNEFSPSAVGKLIEKRLKYIKARVGG